MTRQDLYQGIEIIEGVATLRVSQDDLHAFVEGDVSDFLQEICSMLPRVIENTDICFGLKKAPEWIDDKLLVAQGIAAEDGRDGKIEITVEPLYQPLDTDETDRKETVHINVHPILNVTKDEVIAKKIPPTPGKPGMNIFGEKIEPKPGELKAFKLGEHVEILDKDTLVAACDGAVKVEPDGTISVVTEWVIDGDVDISTGHVEFAGQRLIVTGSICGGLTVEAAGDLIIEGQINDDAIVLAGGRINVSGIIRSRNTILKAGKGLACQAIEYAKVFVGGDAKVNDYVLDANCQVEGSMEILGGKGLIAGGRIELGGSLVTQIAGTPANVPTLIAAGINPLLVCHYEALTKDQEKNAKKLAGIRAGLLKLKKIEAARGGLDAKMKALKKSLIEAAEAIDAVMTSNKTRIQKLEANLGDMERASITILKKAYPNCKIRIDKASMVLDREMEKVCFTFRQGEIAMRHIAVKETGEDNA